MSAIPIPLFSHSRKKAKRRVFPILTYCWSSRYVNFELFWANLHEYDVHFQKPLYADIVWRVSEEITAVPPLFIADPWAESRETDIRIGRVAFIFGFNSRSMQQAAGSYFPDFTSILFQHKPSQLWLIGWPRHTKGRPPTCLFCIFSHKQNLSGLIYFSVIGPESRKVFNHYHLSI